MATTITTEVQQTDGSISTTGTWATVNSSGTNPVYSGGSALQASVVGATLTITFTGRCLYLLTSTYQGTSGGAFTYTLDGTAQGAVACVNDSTQAALQHTKVLVPLVRGATDAAHTVVLTVSSTGPVTVDSVLVVSGARQAPASGTLVCLGDSWTADRGASYAGVTGYPERLGGLLRGQLARPVTLLRKGVGADRLHGGDGTSSDDGLRNGGMYRTYSDVLSSSALTTNGGYPEFLTYLYGANDLRGSVLTTLDTSGQNVGPGTYGRHLHALLCLLEDTLPVRVADGALTKVAIGTPPYLSPFFTLYKSSTSQPGVAQGVDAWEQAVAVTHAVAAQFPWCRVAQVYEVMDQRDWLIYPNAQADAGLHLNDAGHFVVAHEVFRALQGVVG